MSLKTIQALLASDKSSAETHLGYSVPQDWPDAHDQYFLELIAGKLLQNPTEQLWLIRAVITHDKHMVGHVGFHKSPNPQGVIEIGYTIFPKFRGQGYALEAIQALMNWALQTGKIQKFRASVGPWNEPSLHIVRKLGFQQTGIQMDERDGEELIFELEVDSSKP